MSSFRRYPQFSQSLHTFLELSVPEAATDSDRSMLYSTLMHSSHFPQKSLRMLTVLASEGSSSLSKTDLSPLRTYCTSEGDS